MYILVIGLMVLLLLSYYVGREDLFNPVFLCCCFFFFSALCTSYNIECWGIDLSYITISLILFSLLSMIFGGFFGLSLNKKTGHEVVEISLVYLSNIKISCVIVLGLLAAVLYFKDIISIARAYGYGGGSGIGTLMSIYRNASHFSSETEDQVSRLAYYLLMIFRLCSYMITYIGINNLILQTDKRYYKKCFIITLMYCVISLITASRMQLLKMAIFIMLLYFLLLKKSTGWNKHVKVRTLLKIALSAIAVIILFVSVRTLVGRSNTEEPFYYFTKYAGGSIHLLDLFIKNPIESSTIWGKETFYSMYKFLGTKVGRRDWVYVFAKEFRRSNGVALGNVYTALRCYYYDFGFIGCIICSGIVGFIFSAIYGSIHRRNLKKGIDMRLFLYVYLSYSYCLFSVNYYFDYLNLGFLKWVILMYIIRWFLVKLNISFGIKRKRGYCCEQRN